MFKPVAKAMAEFMKHTQPTHNHRYVFVDDTKRRIVTLMKVGKLVNNNKLDDVPLAGDLLVIQNLLFIYLS